MAQAVTHFEIPASDPEAVVDFYRLVFDWAIEQWDGPVDYWLVAPPDDESGIGGAIMARASGPPTRETPVAGYICTVEVDSIDRTLDLVAEHGGEQLMEPRDVPGVGRHAYCADIDGNQFGVMEPAEDGGL